MLTDLDETLRHQAPLVFEHVASTDPRFFDRYWFCAYEPEGDLVLMSGLAIYNNLNVLDGFAVINRGGTQHNFRGSRQLRPAIDDTTLGPLSYEIVEPFRRIDMRLDDGPHGFSFDLQWNGFLGAHEESHHLFRFNGHAAHDYIRYQQVGSVDGTFIVDGVEIEAAGWFGARDHSWGVRPGVGGIETPNGPQEWAVQTLIWAAFKTEDSRAGFVQIHADRAGNRLRTEGVVYWPGEDGTEESIDIVDADYDLSFYDGTFSYESLDIRVVTSDGRSWAIELEPITPAWAYVGSGYDNGYNDGMGLGRYRGELLLEHDVYTVEHPADVVMPDGQVVRPWHRETPSRSTLDGVRGSAHVTVLTIDQSQPASRG